MKKQKSEKPRGISTLLKVLTRHREALVVARSDQVLIAEYDSLIRFLRSAPTKELEHIFYRTQTVAPEASSPQKIIEDSYYSRISLSEIEKLINTDGTPRKILEKIAIYRFNVPAGSMRSFSNRHMLIEKIQASLQSEMAHSTIDSVARG